MRRENSFDTLDVDANPTEDAPLLPVVTDATTAQALGDLAAGMMGASVLEIIRRLMPKVGHTLHVTKRKIIMRTGLTSQMFEAHLTWNKTLAVSDDEVAMSRANRIAAQKDGDRPSRIPRFPLYETGGFPKFFGDAIICLSEKWCYRLA